MTAPVARERRACAGLVDDRVAGLLPDARRAGRWRQDGSHDRHPPLPSPGHRDRRCGRRGRRV